MIKTRIAPSPTGYPHVGTLYQSLFDFSFAQKHGGKFIIRVEDTDKNRFVEGAEDIIYKAFDWAGIIEDESPRKGGENGPYRQSERLDVYQKYAKELVEAGNAYYCFCSRERLDELREKLQKQKKQVMYDKHCRAIPFEDALGRVQKGEQHVIRLKVPEDQKIIIKDEIRGEITFDSRIIDDQVLMKSDGYPTYHLAVVVDDHLMKISHVVRAEEWLSSTPKHFLLYDYFGWEKPLFFHTPDIRNPDKSKLSKRQGHTSVLWYKEQGFLPEALLNYLALLGWSHPDEKEIFSLEEFISLFELKDIKPAGPVFDITKLEWMNGEYIRASHNSKLKTQIHEFYDRQYDEEIIDKTIPLVKERIKKLSDYINLCEFFFKEPDKYEIDIRHNAGTILPTIAKLENLQEWKAEAIGEKMLETAKELGIKNSEYFMTIRVALTGKKITPPLNESMEVLGKEKSIGLLKKSVS
jgi:glutamyl-tRNA synthetase